MTTIVALLVLLYRKANHISYKTAKRRMAIKVRNLTITLIVTQCGNDPNLFLRHKKWPEFLPTMTASKGLFF
jgi:hypothetical protein